MPVLFLFFFFFNDTATTEIYTLSLHDALPILFGQVDEHTVEIPALGAQPGELHAIEHQAQRIRSEEHTSELQSRRDLVCRLLLEKKKRRQRSPGTEVLGQHDRDR